MLTTRVEKTLRSHGMVHPGERIVVGVSGGADSVALTEVLAEIAPRLRLSIAVAHLDHGLRDEAEEDAAFCARLADKLCLPFVSERVDVAALAKKNKRSIEDEGRRQRYRYLESQRVRLEAERVAVGHTLDDQAETFLLRLLRGSGGRGLASLYPVVDGRRIRPLIEIRRREVLAYLDARGIAHREDRSNFDRRFTRNRLRHSAIPGLVKEFNPRLVETLARTASILRDEEDWMDGATRQSFSSVVRHSDGALCLDVQALGRLHPALKRRLARLAIETLRHGLDDVAHVHVEDVLALAAPGKSGREVHLPGLVAERSFGELRLRTPGVNSGRIGRERGYNGFEYRLTIPAKMRIPEGGGTLSARILPPARKSAPGADGSSPAFGNAVTVGIEGNLPLLTVRSPRRGDRFRPLGAPGSKSLARYLMERKVARGDRGSVPLVVRSSTVDSGGIPPGEEILWVVGHGVSEASRLSSNCQRISLEWET